MFELNIVFPVYLFDKLIKCDSILFKGIIFTTMKML